VTGRIELLRLLADGARHSGEELAPALSISRAAVWKRLQQLEEWGIALRGDARQRLSTRSALDLLDTGAIQGPPAVGGARALRNLESTPNSSRPTTAARRE
jgi:BirA family biotin operon repressor/biotin-[acetyl-CoA-carboxylase] ligase